MKNKLSIVWCVIFISLFFTGTGKAWHSFSLPRVIAGGSAGYFRISLNDFYNIYTSKWDNIYSGHANIRVYGGNYLSVQYAQYRNEKAKKEFQTGVSPVWEETFLNIGVRWYSESSRKWNFYSTLGFTFTKITEQPGFSVFPTNQNENTQKDGRGFFAEIGTEYTIFPHVAAFFEIEASTIGEGGNPGFETQSIGGIAFHIGLDFYL